VVRALHPDVSSASPKGFNLACGDNGAAVLPARNRDLRPDASAFIRSAIAVICFCNDANVRTRERTLLDQIQTGALDSSVPLADTLRKVVALGGETGSEELRGWASRELRGYGGSDVELPEYRRPAAPLKVDAFKFNAQITGQSISPRQLPDFVAEKLGEEVPLSAGIGEIEAMLKRAREGDGSVKLMPPMAQDIVRYMNHEIQNHPQGDPYQQITELYWVVSQVTLEGIVDQVRTTLVELVAEMRAEMSDKVDRLPRRSRTAPCSTS
jgi:hypothetical protein